MKVPISGGTPVTLASAQYWPAAIAVDSTSVYWLTEGANYIGSVLKVPIGGGSVTTLASGQYYPAGLAVDPTSVYWTSGDPATPDGGTVVSVPIDGGSPTTLTSGQGYVGSVFLEETNLYWTSEPAMFAEDYVQTMPISGGSVTSLSALQSGGVAGVDSTNLYLTEPNVADPQAGGMLSKMPIAGGTATVLASGVQFTLAGLAVDPTNVYWASGNAAVTDGGTVWSVSIGGGSVCPLATGQNYVSAIAVDATSVYFAAGSALLKLTPK